MCTPRVDFASRPARRHHGGRWRRRWHVLLAAHAAAAKKTAFHFSALLALFGTFRSLIPLPPYSSPLFFESRYILYCTPPHPPPSQTAQPTSTHFLFCFVFVLKDIFYIVPPLILIDAAGVVALQAACCTPRQSILHAIFFFLHLSLSSGNLSRKIEVSNGNTIERSERNIEVLCR